MKRLIVIGLLVASIGYADEPKQAAPASAPADSKEAAAPEVSGDAPQITIEKPKYEFGVVDPGPLEATFIVKNTGKSTLEIKEVKPGCGCTVVPDYDKKIEPGKEGKIKATLNTANMKGHVEKGITITSNDPKKPSFHVTMSADVKVDLNILPSQNIWLGRLRPESQTNQTVEIKSALSDPLVIEKLESSAPWLTVKLVSSTTNSAKLELTTKPPLPYGQNRANVLFHTKYAKYSNVVINVSAQVPATISAVPANLIFTKGESKTVGVIIMRNDGKDFQIQEIKNPSSMLNPTISTNLPGRSYRLNVTYTPQNGSQPENGKIEVLTDEKEWPKVELPFEFR
jgi:hypothetical protein